MESWPNGTPINDIFEEVTIAAQLEGPSMLRNKLGRLSMATLDHLPKLRCCVLLFIQEPGAY